MTYDTRADLDTARDSAQQLTDTANEARWDALTDYQATYDEAEQDAIWGRRTR
jgi:hypothetical protein